jgi:hypothetical protein
MDHELPPPPPRRVEHFRNANNRLLVARYPATAMAALSSDASALTPLPMSLLQPLVLLGGEQADDASFPPGAVALLALFRLHPFLPATDRAVWADYNAAFRAYALWFEQQRRHNRLEGLLRAVYGQLEDGRGVGFLVFRDAAARRQFDLAKFEERDFNDGHLMQERMRLFYFEGDTRVEEFDLQP